MFVAFEGIDGSGKTALSNLVCERLRLAGHVVVHARERGVLASGVARRVRDLTRDTRLLEMSARTELFLNLAREVQQLDEIVRPALARGELVVSDRSLHSMVALAVAGRGLPEGEVLRAVEVAAAGTWPDVVVLVEVDPDLARMRKRVGKILDGREGAEESRKNLAGAGLQVRLGRHFRLIAERNRRWIVAWNEGRPLEAVADEIAAEIAGRVKRGADGPVRVARRHLAARNVAASVDLAPERIAERFRAAVEQLAPGDPALAAFLLFGIGGRPEHALRVRLAPRAPALVARSLRGVGGDDAFALRRVLAKVVPAEVAASLAGNVTPEALALAAELVDAAPAAVAAALARNGSREAWALRARALGAGALAPALEGLAGLADDRAFELRAEGVRRELWAAVGKSLAAVAGARADGLRERLAERDRLAALRSTEGIDCDLARGLRERLFEHAAKRVLRSLAGIDAPYAWALREQALEETKEALDSVDGMDHPRAWALREAGVDAWPATAVSSLHELVATERGRRIVARALHAAPGSIAVLRNARAAYARAERIRTGAPALAWREVEAAACST